MFNLGADVDGKRYHLQRGRKIETNWPLIQPWRPEQPKPVLGIYGGHARVRAAKHGGRQKAERWSRPGVDIMREAMGTERALTGAEVSQGIPPAYSAYVISEYERWLRGGDYGRDAA